MMAPLPERNANRLLVVDTDTRVLKRAAQAGERLGFAVACAADQAQLRDEVARFAPTVIMIDPDGIGTLDEDPFRWLGERRERATLILASEQEPIPLSPGEVAMAYGLEVNGALRKPLRDEALDEALLPLYIRRKRVTEQDLRRAVDRAQLCAHYQPRMRLGAYGWTVAGVEALLRWDHPDYGLIYPDEFIGLAEEHGLIAGLTDFVLQSGIDQLSAWNRAGMNLALSVNLSSKLFTDLEFADRMSDFLWSRGVAPDQLTLEITESGALEDPRGTLEILSRLRARGIGLALDDFGIGYSSLTQLYKLPFSEVKIDKSVGIEIPQTPAARMIVRAIVDLGHHLGLTVCCEGVETGTALDVLQQCGCDYAQGYFIARPMAAAEVAPWIAAREAENPLTARAVS